LEEEITMANLKKLAQIARAQGLSPIMHADHRAPMTRRDLVAQGFLAGGAYVLTPSILAMLSGRAYGAPDCGAGSADATAPVNGIRIMAFEAAGGMNIAGSNFMVWGANGKGDTLPPAGLGVLGVPAARATATVNEDFGIAMHPDSALLNGLLAATSPGCRAKVNGVPFCVSSADDSSNNPFSLAYWANKAGAKGTLSSLIGSETTAHGARSMAPVESVSASVSSTQIRSFDDARNLVTAASLETAMPGRVGSILKAASGMSSARIKMLTDKELPEQVRTLIECGYISSETAVSGNLSDAVDARQDAALVAALAAAGGGYDPTLRNFQINRNIAQGDTPATLSAAYLLLKGYSGFATRVMGGRDYHNNPRQDTNQKDFDVGFQMGTVLEAAHTMGKSIALVLQTDGGVGCSDPNTPDNPNAANNPAGGQAMFTSDRGEGSCMILMVYHPKGRPALSNDIGQVNSFNTNGAVDQNNPDGKIIANSPTNAIQSILLNILALNGRLGDAETILGAGHPFKDAGVLEKYVMFGAWPT
jgi:hypothetical protein